jgi:hypothetical protein
MGMSLQLREMSKTIVVTDDILLDLINGVINPYDFLTDESADKVQKALEMLDDFEALLIREGILDYMENT